MVRSDAELLSLQDVGVTFDDNIVIEGLTFSVSRGERVAIMGASGCGKSSLLSSIVGLVPLSSGVISVDGVQVKHSGVDRVRRKVAWLPQQLQLPIAVVRELFDNHFALRVNAHLSFDEQRCRELLHRVGLEGDILERSWSTLSGGERARVLLVCAVMLEREVMLLDEPTSALDRASSEAVAELLASLEGVAIIAVTHDELLAQSFDKLIRL